MRQPRAYRAPRVRIPDLRREEFKEALRRTLADDGGDKGGDAIGEDGDELVCHCKSASNKVAEDSMPFAKIRAVSRVTSSVAS